MADEWQGQLSHTHALGAGSPSPRHQSQRPVPGRGTGPTLQGATFNEELGQLCNF